MKRYTLSVYDNTVKEPVMTIQVDELSSGHDKDEAWLRAGKVPFTQQVFNIEQKFAAGFDPGRVLAAVREDAEKLTQPAAKPLEDPNYNTAELRKVADYILATPERCTNARERYLARAILSRLKT